MPVPKILLPLAIAAAAVVLSACTQQVRATGTPVPQAAVAEVARDVTVGPVAPRPGEPAPTEVTTEQVAGPVARLEVMTTAGRVVVRGSDAPGVSVTRSTYREPVAPEEAVRRDGDLLQIRSGCPQDETPAAPCRIDYDITVPRATLVTLLATAGDLTTTGLSGPIAARSVSGTVLLDRHSSSSTVAESTSGDIEVDLLTRPETLSATTVSGDLRVRAPDDGPYELDATTVSGEIEVGVRSDPAARSRLNLRTTSGDLAVTTG
jgi:putative adhesin